jgi:hypothetical protein
MELEIEAERFPRRTGALPQSLDLIEQQLRIAVVNRENGEPASSGHRHLYRLSRWGSRSGMTFLARSSSHGFSQRPVA